jgi:hypothetical protein
LLLRLSRIDGVLQYDDDDDDDAIYDEGSGESSLENLFDVEVSQIRKDKLINESQNQTIYKVGDIIFVDDYGEEEEDDDNLEEKFVSLILT